MVRESCVSRDEIVVLSEAPVIAKDGNVLRLYWMPGLLWLDGHRAGLFIDSLNLKGGALVLRVMAK